MIGLKIVRRGGAKLIALTKDAARFFIERVGAAYLIATVKDAAGVIIERINSVSLYYRRKDASYLNACRKGGSAVVVTLLAIIENIPIVGKFFGNDNKAFAGKNGVLFAGNNQR